MEALDRSRMRVMAAPRKYGDELHERATRMTVHARKDPAKPDQPSDADRDALLHILDGLLAKTRIRVALHHPG
jgi:hypothetical protein